MTKREIVLVAIIIAISSAILVFSVIGNEESQRYSAVQVNPQPRQVISRPPSMSPNEAQQHRSDRFADLSTIEQTLRLPSEFDQTEALYVIAGRANTNALLELIDQASRIEDLTDRRGALVILFSRLTDIDPHAAVELAGRPKYANYGRIEWSIWRAWSRSNLEQALVAAKQLVPQSRKESAAQQMYFAYGIYNGNETDQIKEALNIEPSSWARRHYIITLAETSPNNAMNFLNSVRPFRDQNYIAREVGTYMGNKYSETALNYSSLIKSLPSRKQYRTSTLRAIAAATPNIVLERWLQDPSRHNDEDSVEVAFKQLAQSNFDDALSFWNQIEVDSVKLSLTKTIAAHLGSDDIFAALEWASNAQSQGLESAFVVAVAELAKIDPLATFDGLYGLSPGGDIDKSIALVIGEITKLDPLLAIAKIAELPIGANRRLANASLLRAWVNLDTEAAVAYAVEKQDEIDEQVLRQFSRAVPLLDSDTVVSYLPSLKQGVANAWMRTMLETLVTDKSHLEIEAFLQQYRHLDIYPEMQAELVSQLQIKDPDYALALASNMQSGKAKDRAMSRLLTNLASTDPQRAARLMPKIKDDETRSNALQMLTYYWQEKDSDALRNWVTRLPNGNDRDQAISVLTVKTDGNLKADLRLINSIADDELRQETLLSSFVKIAATNPQQARDLTAQMNLPEADLKRLEEVIRDCYSDTATKESIRKTCGRRGRAYH